MRQMGDKERRQWRHCLSGILRPMFRDDNPSPLELEASHEGWQDKPSLTACRVLGFEPSCEYLRLF